MYSRECHLQVSKSQGRSSTLFLPIGYWSSRHISLEQPTLDRWCDQYTHRPPILTGIFSSTHFSLWFQFQLWKFPGDSIPCPGRQTNVQDTVLPRLTGRETAGNTVQLHNLNWILKKKKKKATITKWQGEKMLDNRSLMISVDLHRRSFHRCLRCDISSLPLASRPDWMPWLTRPC